MSSGSKIISIALMIFTSCASTSGTDSSSSDHLKHKKTAKRTKAVKEKDDTPTLAVISDEKTTPTPTPAASVSTTGESNSEKNCLKLFSATFTHFQTLAKLKTKHNDWPKGLPRPEFMLNTTSAICQQSEGYEQILAALTSLLNNHTGKIGVLLPLKQQRPQMILKGIQLALGDAANRIVAFDVSDSSGKIERPLSDLIYTHQVSVLVGGYDNSSADALRTWSERLMIPAIILGDSTKPSERTFFIYPGISQLASKMMREAKAYGWNRLGMIYPVNSDQMDLVKSIQEQSQKEGLNIVHTETYTSGNYDSMDAMVKKLFILEQSQRPEEYQAAYLKAKRIAENQKQPFNAKNVVLQPKVEFDALVILDQSRMVRHLAKIFQFYGVRSLRMIGHQEWRFPNIISPYDPFFEGSFFSDIIGSYSMNAKRLQINREVSDFFAPADTLQEIDFKYIGFKVGESLKPVIQNTQIARRKIHETLQASGNFDASKQYKWPMEIFTIRNKNLISTSRSQ